MEHETSIPSLSGRIYTERSVFSDDNFEDELEIDFDFGLTRKLKASILRIHPVYTIPVQGDFSLFGKAGIAFIERDFKVSISTEYALEDELRQEIDIDFPTSLQVVSESDSTTSLFASAGIGWSLDNGRSTVSIRRVMSLTRRNRAINGDFDPRLIDQVHRLVVFERFESSIRAFKTKTHLMPVVEIQSV